MFFSAADALGATGETDSVVQPLTGWLIGVLIILVFSLLSRHRPTKFGRHQVKPGNGDN